jgi:hypothetical protein
MGGIANRASVWVDECLAALARLSPGVSRMVAYLACAGTAASLFYQLAQPSNAYLGLFADDFFYYAVIADNFVRLGKLTFDGITSTNGFHPLWFAVIVLVRVIAGSLGRAFFAGLAAVLFAAMVASYELLRRLARALGAPPALAAPLAAIACTTAVPLIGTGMEVALAIPVYALLLAEVARGVGPEAADTTALSPALTRRAARLGALASVAVLARLDLAVAVALLIGAWLALGRRRTIADSVRLLATFGAAGIAVPAYFAFNRVAFGALLPTSARAKQMRAAGGLSVHFLREGVGAYGTGRLAIVVAGLVALAVLVWRDPRARRPARLAAAVGLSFPFVFSILNASLSDWFFFPWYAYPLPAALLAGGVVLWESAPPLVQRPWPRLLASVALGGWLVGVVPAIGYGQFLKRGPGWSTGDNTLLAMALELDNRLPDPGVRTFAMGDKAGVTSFVLKRPVVQLEGLVADGDLLESIRKQESLEHVFARYGVDYLIVSLSVTSLERRDGCFVIMQPNPQQAGLRSSRMVGKVCAPPLLHFYTPAGPHSWSGTFALETFVFDVRGDRWRALSAL